MNFEYTEENLKNLIKFLSEERLEKYVEIFNTDYESCIKLYVYNTRISEALYTPLQGIEIAVRNAIDLQLVKKYGQNWHMLDSAIFDYPLTEMPEKADNVLKKQRANVTRGAIVAELNFGFWVSALAPRYEAPLWRQCLRHSFPFRPPRYERKQVHNALNAIRRLRNRVMHHEPILHRSLESDHETITRVISWICPDTTKWITEQSRFSDVFRTDAVSSKLKAQGSEQEPFPLIRD